MLAQLTSGTPGVSGMLEQHRSWNGAESADLLVSPLKYSAIDWLAASDDGLLAVMSVSDNDNVLVSIDEVALR